ncbi:MAG: bifunctional DNA primase/polymerase [Deltaproteobacteria bacterium]|nr:bifunctional DNA primase/polymerase [Deltaproteobacteria bacterium]
MILTSTEHLLTAALRYAELGYLVFPCASGGKTPITPRGFKDATTDSTQITAWWKKSPNANIGMPTAGLLVVDVDGQDNPWPGDPQKAEDLACGPISLTPRGGRHYVFRQPEGETWRNTAGKIGLNVDTRADGGYIIVPPSVVDGKAYRWAETFELNVAPDELPQPPEWLTDLLDSLGDMFARGAAGGDGDGQIPASAAGGSPKGTDLPPDGNTIPSGTRNATLARLAGNMRRVGMTRDEILVALERTNRDRCRPPLPGQEVERIATSICRYEPDQVAVAVVEDHWAQDQRSDPAPPDTSPVLVDPGPLPEELLRIPGFVSEVMDHCLATAPYPNQVMAFCGALALQAVLSGRKVRDPGDNRTNLYLLGLAHSAAGKDLPRKVNTEILHAIGLSSQVGGRFASGEGVQDALNTEPSMLFQTDEIDGMLQSINKSKDARHESIMNTLLTMYSSANSVFPMRRKAGKESPGAINQPHLVVFGTAIPNHYYEALSERMLTNGFFARMIILECGKRSPGQEPSIRPLPARVLEVAKWWADYRPGTGNLQNWHPAPRIVPHTDEAKAILIETRLEAEAEYERAESSRDAVGTTVWGRVNEHVRKLALLYAVSENHEHTEINRKAVDWARKFVIHQTRRMLFMAQAFVADNPFHAECLKFLQKLREAPGQELSHSALLKRTRMEARNFLMLVETLEQQGDIVIRTQSTSGRPSRFYRLAGQIKDTEK